MPVLTSVFLVFLFIRRHTFRSGREEVHCARFEASSFEICVTWSLRFCESAVMAWIMTANKVSYCLNFRCHALVAVQGVEQRPQTIGNFNQVLVQLRNLPWTSTLESSSSNASVQPWRSSWASNTSATSEYCITIVPKKYFSLYLFIRHQTCEFRKKLFSLSSEFFKKKFFIRRQT